MKLLDLKALSEATEKVVTLPEGQIRIRRLSRAEYIRLLPRTPDEVLPKPTGKETPEQMQALNEEAVARELQWLDSLPPAERVGRRSEMLEAVFAAVARAVLEPPMTVADVKRLGDGAFFVFAELEQFWRAEAQAVTNGEPAVVAA